VFFASIIFIARNGKYSKKLEGRININLRLVYKRRRYSQKEYKEDIICLAKKEEFSGK